MVFSGARIGFGPPAPARSFREPKQVPKMGRPSRVQGGSSMCSAGYIWT